MRNLHKISVEPSFGTFGGLLAVGHFHLPWLVSLTYIGPSYMALNDYAASGIVS